MAFVIWKRTKKNEKIPYWKLRKKKKKRKKIKVRRTQNV